LAETDVIGKNLYYTYVLWSSRISKRYVGSTDNVKKRLEEHNRGCNKFTKGGIPWIKVYQEEYLTKTEALKREKFFKLTKVELG
jgi:putative endonuclease